MKNRIVSRNLLHPRTIRNDGTSIAAPSMRPRTQRQLEQVDLTDHNRTDEKDAAALTRKHL